MGDAELELEEPRRVGGMGERERERDSRWPDRLLERSLIFSLMAPKKLCSAEGAERGMGLLKQKVCELASGDMGSKEAFVEVED